MNAVAIAVARDALTRPTVLYCTVLHCAYTQTKSVTDGTADVFTIRAVVSQQRANRGIFVQFPSKGRGQSRQGAAVRVQIGFSQH